MAKRVIVLKEPGEFHYHPTVFTGVATVDEHGYKDCYCVISMGKDVAGFSITSSRDIEVLENLVAELQRFIGEAKELVATEGDV